MTWVNDKWYCLTNGRIYRDRKKLGMAYQKELAARVESLGYGITWKDNGLFEIDGFLQEQLRAFSKRRRQIENLTKQSDWKSRQLAALKTRQPKQLSTESELVQFWQDTARAVGLEFEVISNTR